MPSTAVRRLSVGIDTLKAVWALLPATVKQLLAHTGKSRKTLYHATQWLQEQRCIVRKNERAPWTQTAIEPRWPPAPQRVSEEHKRALRLVWMRRRRALKMARGFCGKCQRRAARLGRKTCAVCIAKYAANTTRRRLDPSICRECKCTLTAAERKKPRTRSATGRTCFRCRARGAARSARRRAERKANA